MFSCDIVILCYIVPSASPLTFPPFVCALFLSSFFPSSHTALLSPHLFPSFLTHCPTSFLIPNSNWLTLPTLLSSPISSFISPPSMSLCRHVPFPFLISITIPLFLAFPLFPPLPTFLFSSPINTALPFSPVTPFHSF